MQDNRVKLDGNVTEIEALHLFFLDWLLVFGPQFDIS
jgi:hypothetical protein